MGREVGDFTLSYFEEMQVGEVARVGKWQLLWELTTGGMWGGAVARPLMQMVQTDRRQIML